MIAFRIVPPNLQPLRRLHDDEAAILVETRARAACTLADRALADIDRALSAQRRRVEQRSVADVWRRGVPIEYSAPSTGALLDVR
jgi:hypothetical protein